MSEREARKFFFASGDASGVVSHRWRRPLPSKLRPVGTAWGSSGQWARLCVLYFGGAVGCDSDAFAAVKPG
jgi:hypothetical protein